MALPVSDDALAEILLRLPLQSLAVARCVCNELRALIDGRALLLPRLLPHSVHGVLINYIDHRRPHLFSRPGSSASAVAASGGRRIDGNLSSSVPCGDRAWWSVMDHCNGLLLCDVYWGSRFCVCNPATRRWATLPPPCPEPARVAYAGGYLAFDPAVSRHYEVFLIPALPKKPPPPPSPTDDDDDEAYRSMAWPPSPYKVDVFSSRTGRWEERAFVRDGETATMTTVEDMKPAGPRGGYSVFWQGALYVHSGGHFVTRFSISNDKYQVIKTPVVIRNNKFEKPYLGKSKMGVSFGFIHGWQLCVWTLKESAGQMEWFLNYQHDLSALYFHGVKINGPWVLQDDKMRRNVETLENKEREWDSDNDDFLTIEDDEGDNHFAYIHILGFHPSKEVVFLEEKFRTAAYHLNSSKIQYLGYARPRFYYQEYIKGINESFVYTPCVIGELNGHYIAQSSSG